MNGTNTTQPGRLMQEESKPSWQDLVRDQIGSLRFGTVLITVHDGRVVQVEKNEKVRLDQPNSPAARSNQRV